MFELDFRSRTPIYEQLVEKFKELIIKKILKPDEQLPSVRVLASQLTVNPNTINKAYHKLEQEGYIYSVPGKGNFVSPDVSGIQSARLKSLKLEFFKIVSEMNYLGLNKEDIMALIKDLELVDKGGPED
jgi:GntR family transcriptional regulator